MSYGKCMFNFVRNYQTISQSSYTILHSHKQSMRVLVAPHPSQHWVLLHIFFKNHANRCTVLPHCGFNLNFCFLKSSLWELEGKKNGQLTTQFDGTSNFDLLPQSAFCYLESLCYLFIVL